MYRKVKVKPILELIYAKQSNSQIADALKVSRVEKRQCISVINIIIHSLNEIPITSENIRKKIAEEKALKLKESIE